MERCLGDVYVCTPTINTQDSVKYSQVDEDEGSRSDTALTSISVRSTRTQISTISLTPTPQRPSSSILDVQRRRASNPELQEAEKQMKEAFSTLSNVLSKRSHEMLENNDDDCDLYGKLLAKKLRKLPDDEREEAMFEIDVILLQKMCRRNTNNLWYAGPPSRSLNSSNQSTITSPMASPQPAPSPAQGQVPNPVLTTLSTDPVTTRDIHESTSDIYTEQTYNQPLSH